MDKNARLRWLLSAPDYLVPGGRDSFAHKMATALTDMGYDVGVGERGSLKFFSGDKLDSARRPAWTSGLLLANGYHKASPRPELFVPVVLPPDDKDTVRALLVAQDYVVEAKLLQPFTRNHWNLGQKLSYRDGAELKGLLDSHIAAAKKDKREDSDEDLVVVTLTHRQLKVIAESLNQLASFDVELSDDQLTLKEQLETKAQELGIDLDIGSDFQPSFR